MLNGEMQEHAEISRVSYINHGGGPMCSIDAHPTDARKLITSGSDKDGRGVIVIWNTCHIDHAYRRAHSDESKVFFRADVDCDCVNCVRFSNKGDRFVAAGNSQSITVWQFQAAIDSAGTFGEDKSERSVELWRLTHQQLAHEQDALHVEWSPDDKMLATCGSSLDVMVWKIDTKDLDRIARLEGHQGFVKGLCWDPLGRYLATQGADSCIRLWNTTKWECTKVINDCFGQAPDITPFIRSSWSIDGGALFCAQATSGTLPTVHIVYRSQEFTGNKDLLGHRKRVSAVRAAPSLYTEEAAPLQPVNGSQPKRAKRYSTLVACGGHDQTLTIWRVSPTGNMKVDSVSRRPMLVFTDLPGGGIQDVTWSCTVDKPTVFACTSHVQGQSHASVFCVRLPTTGIGRPLSSTEMLSYMRNTYKNLPQTVRLTRLIAPTASSSDSDDVITLSSAVSSNDDADPFAESAKKSPSKSLSHNRRESSTNEALTKSTTQEASSAKATILKEAPVAKTSEPPHESQKQTVTIGKDGKKRIKPIFESALVVSSSTERTKVLDSVPSPTKVARTIEPEQPVKRKQSLLTGVHIPELGVTELPPIEAKTAKRARRVLESDSEDDDEAPSTSHADAALAPLSASKSTHTCAQLPAASAQASLTCRITDVQNDLPIRQATLIIVRNQACTTTRAYSRLRVFADEAHTDASNLRDLIWETLVDGTALCLRANCHHIVIVSIDAKVHTLRAYSTQTGLVQLPPVVLEAPPSRLTMHEHTLMLLSSDASISVWDLSSIRLQLSRVSLAPLLADSSISIVYETFASDKHTPIVALSDGRLFTYAQQLQSWLLADAPNSALQSRAGHEFDRSAAKSTQGALSANLQQKQRPRVEIASSDALSRTCMQQLLAWRSSVASFINSDEHEHYVQRLIEVLEGNEPALRELREAIERERSNGRECEKLLQMIQQQLNTNSSSETDPL